MPLPALRPMAPDDVEPAAEMILSHDWGVRREWLAFAATQPACVPLVAEADGAIVATGVGTANGMAGWIGTIFVAPAWRGQGLGRALTQAIIDRLESSGCRTLLLVATREGRLLYERMGFEIQTRYRILEAAGLRGQVPAGVRAVAAADLDAMSALDLEATAENRAHALRRLAAPSTGRIVTGGATGAIDAFVVRPPWGGGATIARSVDAALEIIRARRIVAGPTGRVRVGVLDENEAGLAALAALGFVAQWSAPRMVRGAPLAWHPDRIWGQFNHAMG